MIVTASLVLYKNDIHIVKKTISSLFDSNLDIKLYLIDNSPTDDLKLLSKINDRIEYYHNASNTGFGSGHNYAIKKTILNKTKYHFIINDNKKKQINIESFKIILED